LNTIGQNIKEEVVKADDGVLTERIGLDNNLAAGMYFVKVIANDQVLTSRLIIRR